MKIAVLMPAYNSEKTVGASVRSIIAQVLPKDVYLEVFIIDNGSTDNTAKMAKTFSEFNNNDHIHFNDVMSFSLKSKPTGKERGYIPALNYGLYTILKKDSFDYVARLDADDTWIFNKTEKQVEFLRKNPEIFVLGTQMRIIGVKDNLISYTSYPLIDSEIKVSLSNGVNPLGHSSVLINTDVFYMCGAYDSVYPLAEDMHLWYKASQFYKLANLPEVLVNYYSNPNPNYNPLCPNVLAQSLNFSRLNLWGVK